MEWTASVQTLHVAKPDVARGESATEFGTDFTHVTCNVTCLQSAQNLLLRYRLYIVQTCDVTRVQSATQWTAAVPTFHMPKPVI